MQAIHVMYVDDEPGMLELGKTCMEMHDGFHVDTADSGMTALAMLERTPADAIIADYLMPEMDGIALLREVRSRSGMIPFILFTGHGTEESAIEAVNNGADLYLRKGSDPAAQFAEIAGKVRQFVSRQGNNGENHRAWPGDPEEMVYRTDMDGAITMASVSAARFAGYATPGEMVGKNIRQVYQDPGEQDRILAVLQKGGSPGGNLVSFKKTDGTTLSATIYSHYYHDARGRALGIESVLHDVTALQVAGRALQEANRKLNLLNSITRHDMINQLMVLRGFLELARKDPPHQELATYLEKCARITDNLERQITFTRDYQNLGIKAPAWQNIHTVIGSETAALPARNIQIIKDCPGVEVYADPLFEKVFHNLIDNALKYGKEQLTTIRFSCRKTQDGMVITCEDDGAGIAPGDKKHLFERGSGKSTGLGLFLSREILSITGITISENSEPGTGARFEILVPAGTYRYSRQ